MTQSQTKCALIGTFRDQHLVLKEKRGVLRTEGILLHPLGRGPASRVGRAACAGCMGLGLCVAGRVRFGRVERVQRWLREREDAGEGAARESEFSFANQFPRAS